MTVQPVATGQPYIGGGGGGTHEIVDWASGTCLPENL